MSNDRRWSRRQLLGCAGITAAIALAGCNGSENSGPETEFTLAGDGADPFRDWLNPDHVIDSDTDRETKQLYQFNDFTLAAEGNWDSQIGHRDNAAGSLGADPDAFDGELLLGPVQDGVPNRVFFGEFDTAAVGEQLQANGIERTDEFGAYTVYGELFAVSETAIVNHAGYETVIETADGERDRIGDVDEDVGLVLDLLPEGMMNTIARREGDSEIVLDALTIKGRTEDGFRNHEIRTLVFEDESAASTDRARELIEAGAGFDEIPTEEKDGRVVMVEVRRS